MSGWILDTNVLSEIRKRGCDENVRQWITSKKALDLYVSTVTFAEIRFGIDRLEDPNRRHALERWLEGELRPWFGDRLLGIDESTILRWRELVEKGRVRGRTFSQPDLFIAASASLHGLCLATRNTGDFEGAGVPVVNPWKA